MALIPNSSLNHWMSFGENAWYKASFPPCQYVNWTKPNADEPTHNLKLPIITNASCTQVCNDSRSLFGWQENLVTCGIWSTLAYVYTFDGPAPNPNRYTEEAPAELLSSFANVGLDAHDPEYFQSAVSYADVMSACFVYLYQNVKAWKSADDGLVSGACTKNGLFPYSSASNTSGSVEFQFSTTAVYYCLEDICSPVALNPEFSGIGFVISFVLQSFIVIAAFTVLLGLTVLGYSTKITLVALFNFHKAQCYFSSTVQITALIIFHGVLTDTGIILGFDDFTGAPNGFVDTSALVILATSSFIPVTFGLATITRFGHPSWHMIVLSLITFALATTTLSTFYHYDRQYGKLDDYHSSLQNDNYLQYGTCAIGGHVGDSLFPLCGSSLLNNNVISSSTITNWWVWVAWAICLAWVLKCFYNKLMGATPLETVLSTLDSAPTRYPRMKLLKEFIGRLNGRVLILVVMPILCFGLCFGVQFYLIAVFAQHHLVSQVWSFGQIIAVAFWLPSIFEYYHDIQSNILHGQSLTEWLVGIQSQNFKDLLCVVKNNLNPKGKPLIQATRDIVNHIVNRTKDVLIGRSNDAASLGSDPEAGPVQSLNSAVESHGTGQENQQQEIVIEDFVRPA